MYPLPFQGQGKELGATSSSIVSLTECCLGLIFIVGWSAAVAIAYRCHHWSAAHLLRVGVLGRGMSQPLAASPPPAMYPLTSPSPRLDMVHFHAKGTSFSHMMVRDGELQMWVPLCSCGF